MALSTYSELKTSIAGWLNREDADTIAKIPDFIALAEAKIARDVRHWRQEKRVTTSVNEQYENLPNDWLEMIQIQLIAGGSLKAISASELQGRKEVSLTVNKPKYYRLTSDQIELYPKPNQSYEASMQYYARVPALSDAETFNWILTDYPDIYLYGSLIHAAPYLIDDQRLNVWASLYQSAVDALNKDSTNSRVSGPLRIGMPR
jgi:hypothetical protein